MFSSSTETTIEHFAIKVCRKPKVLQSKMKVRGIFWLCTILIEGEVRLQCFHFVLQDAVQQGCMTICVECPFRIRRTIISREIVCECEEKGVVRKGRYEMGQITCGMGSCAGKLRKIEGGRVTTRRAR